jgi:thiamine pyrophosphate-dependent acetolactate synthase large subunit-like protein
VDALRELAREANIGVANTWSAKGLFRWDDPHHLGTVGLQERDLELLGALTAREVIVTGLDEDEVDLSALPMAMPVEPSAIIDLDLGFQETIERPELYERLAAVVQPLAVSEKTPPSPARVLAELATSGAPVVAEPGTPTAFWVARAFPTSELGQVTFATPATIEWGPDDVDWGDTQLLLDVAGAVVAWGGVGF